jgi:hypothetical protein
MTNDAQGTVAVDVAGSIFIRTKVKDAQVLETHVFLMMAIKSLTMPVNSSFISV